MPSVAFTHAITRSTYTLLSPADGERDGLTDEEGEALCEGDKLADELLEAEAEGDKEGELDLDGLTEALALLLGETDGLGERDAD
ncbi:MAG: hypothetical protein NUV69_00500 [Candidatus Curtissbacteria bacterium]|nr:hypothetical protein [Candidatus Curtissbacteria bacterium]